MNEAMMIHADSPTRTALRRIAVLLACALVLSGCSTVKGWFGGKGSDAISSLNTFTHA